MVVVAMIAILTAIAVPNFLRSRKRSQAIMLLSDIRVRDQALNQYAVDTGKKEGDAWDFPDLVPYLKKDSRIYGAIANGAIDILGNPFFGTRQVNVGTASSGPVTISRATFNALSSATPAEF